MYSLEGPQENLTDLYPQGMQNFSTAAQGEVWTACFATPAPAPPLDTPV